MNNSASNIIVIKLFIIFSFHFSMGQAAQATSAVGSISPNSATAGTSDQNFTYTLTLSNGTADSISITNPLQQHPIIVTAVTIDGNIKSLINQNNRPINSSYVSWFYDEINYQLIIISDSSAISNSAIINMAQSIPQTISTNNEYTSIFDDISDPASSIPVNEGEWTVDILPGNISAIFIEDENNGSGNQINNISLNTDQSLILHSIGRDQYNNFVESVNSNWSVENDIGDVSPEIGSSTTFNPTTIGSGAISIQYTTFSDQTGIITVTGGALDYLLIRDEANGGGSEVGDVTMTTDESLSLYAAGYDELNNYLLDVDVTWSVTGDLDAVTSSGSSIEFSPSTSSTSGTIVVSSPGVTSDATGTITVISPPVIEFIESTLSPTLVYAGLDTNFSINVSNTGDLSVTLYPETNFTFTDGIETYYAALLDSVYIESGSNGTLVFENQIISSLMDPGQYTPYLSTSGLDEYGNAYSQEDIPIGFNELSVAGFTINSIYCASDQVMPGEDSIEVTITVINDAPQIIDNIDVNILFSIYESEFEQIRIDTVESISPNEQVTFIVQVDVSESIPPGDVNLDCSIRGSIDDLVIYEVGANNIDSWEVLSFPEISIVGESFTPEHIAQGQDVAFDLRLDNMGTMSVTLDQETHLQLFDGSDSIICNINDEISIPGSAQNILLNFNTTVVPISFLAQSYEPTIKIHGHMENGAEYYQQIDAIDTLTIYEKISINIIEGTLEPDTVIQGQNSILSIDINSNSPMDLVFDVNETSLSVNINDVSYTSISMGEPSLEAGDQSTISYNSIQFPMDIQFGDYDIAFQFIGETDPFDIPFLSFDTTEFVKLTVIGPPEVEYEYGLEPVNIVIGEMVAFQIYLQNNGMCPVELNTESTIFFTDGLSSFYANLAAPVLIPANSTNQLVIFEEASVPETFNFGNYLCYSNLIATTSTGAPYTVIDMELDSLSVESGKGPAIVNIRYEDGGYRGIPDGKINENDIIKVKFDEGLNHEIIDGKNANEYFVLVSEGDQFGYTDPSVVLAPINVDYSGIDMDSCLFIELGSDPVLATNCASNREEQNTTVLKAEDSPSLLIIDPNIDLDILEGISMSDAGFLTNRPFLDDQLTNIDAPDKEGDHFSKFSILVEDSDAPLIINFYPNEASTRVSPFSPLKGFISGRNFMYIDDLIDIISNYSLQGMDMDELVDDPSSYVPQYLKTIITDFNEEQVLNMIDELRSYQMVDKGDMDQVIINPVKQMYTNIKEPLFFTYSSTLDAPEEFSQPFNTELIFDNTIDDQTIGAALEIYNNFEIVNRDSLVDGSFAWFKINTVLEDNGMVISKSIVLDPNNQYLSDNGYFIWSAPNPYNVGKNEPMLIEYELASSPSSLGIKIIDSSGMLVREWNSATIPKLKGKNRIPLGWDGRNGDKVRISPGAYILVLYIGNEIKSTWVCVVK